MSSDPPRLTLGVLVSMLDGDAGARLLYTVRWVNIHELFKGTGRTSKAAETARSCSLLTSQHFSRLHNKLHRSCSKFSEEGFLFLIMLPLHRASPILLSNLPRLFSSLALFAKNTL